MCGAALRPMRTMTARCGVSQVSLAAKQLSVWTSRDAEMVFHLSTYGAVALGAPLPLLRNVPLRPA